MTATPLRVLVAGGTGFLGRALLAELADRFGPADDPGAGPEVLVLSRGRSTAGPYPAAHPRIRSIVGEWSTASHDERVLDFAPQVVVNLVGDSHPRSSVGREAQEIGSQVLPFLELIDALEPRGLERVVFSSSAGSIYRSGTEAVVKDRADTAYHATKRSIEHYLSSRSSATGLQAVSMRISNPVGDLDRPGFGVVGHFARAVLRGEEVDFIGDSATPKDYVALEDVAVAIASLLAGPWPGVGHRTVDIGSGWAIDAPGMHKLIRSLADEPAETAGVDPGRSPLDVGFTPSSLDLAPMRRLTGWTPRHDIVASVERLLRREARQR